MVANEPRLPRLLADPAMARALLNGRQRQVRVPLAAPLANLGAGARIALAEAVVPGRFGDSGELATDRRRAAHVAYADGWRRDRHGHMWRGPPIADAAEKWLAAVHMPDWACRLVLNIAWTRAELLCAITRADARAQGFGGLLPRRAFARHWDATHGFAGMRWADDPQVVVLGLTVDQI
jgi:hypothetical protein